MKSQLLKSSVFRYVEVLSRIVISLILTPYLITHLGDDNYGLWILVLSTLGWFSFADLGFSSAVQRQLSFAINKNDSHRVNHVYSCSLFLFCILGLIIKP